MNNFETVCNFCKPFPTKLLLIFLHCVIQHHYNSRMLPPPRNVVLFITSKPQDKHKILLPYLSYCLSQESLSPEQQFSELFSYKTFMSVRGVSDNCIDIVGGNKQRVRNIRWCLGIHKIS